jgi:hypothetical protein
VEPLQEENGLEAASEIEVQIFSRSLVWMAVVNHATVDRLTEAARWLMHLSFWRRLREFGGNSKGLSMVWQAMVRSSCISLHSKKNSKTLYLTFFSLDFDRSNASVSYIVDYRSWEGKRRLVWRPQEENGRQTSLEMHLRIFFDVFDVRSCRVGNT